MVGSRETVLQSSCHRILKRTKSKFKKKKKELQFLQNQILKEKIKISPNQKQINIWQQELEDIENYKTQGTVIRNKEKIVINQEKPNKFFYQ